VPQSAAWTDGGSKERKETCCSRQAMAGESEVMKNSTIPDRQPKHENCTHQAHADMVHNK
jgi:hypothetical protein